jgi:hypothetical protein
VNFSWEASIGYTQTTAETHGGCIALKAADEFSG